ncbi:MAG: preprotein translocase subunit SecG [Acutalibacteraceae bacterium]|jgi:preprotein translocase, secG subunit
MNVWQIVIGSVMMLVCLIIIAIVLLQQGRRSGVSAISGGADTFLAKSKSRSKDAKLARLTKVMAVIFFVIAIAANAIAIAVK